MRDAVAAKAAAGAVPVIKSKVDRGSRQWEVASGARAVKVVKVFNCHRYCLAGSSYIVLHLELPLPSHVYFAHSTSFFNLLRSACFGLRMPKNIFRRVQKQ